MGWDAERAEDAYWEARASGLSDDEIMAMDGPDWEDQGSTPPWAPPEDPNLEAHYRDGMITEDPQTGGYPDWTPTARELLELFSGGQRKITVNPKEGLIMSYGYESPERTMDELRRAGLASYNAAHGRVPGAEPKTKDELVGLMAWAARRVAELEADPKEPELDEDGPMVISFEVIRSGIRYAYAALRIPSGKRAGQWVVTGPTSPSYLSWEGLLDWVKKINDGHKLPALRHADEWFTFHRAS